MIDTKITNSRSRKSVRNRGGRNGPAATIHNPTLEDWLLFHFPSNRNQRRAQQKLNKKLLRGGDK